jgi:hypothetical protein
VSAPERPAVVLRFDARTAPTRLGPPGLARRLADKETQLDAVLDAVATEATFEWLGSLEEPPPEVAVHAYHARVRDHFARIALNATDRKGPRR